MSVEDDAVRGALKASYPEPGGAGVVRVVRERVARGETGIVPPTGGGAAWLAWIGGALAIGVLAAGLGAAGVFGHPAVGVWESGSPAGLVRTAVAADCPGGSPVTVFSARQRVLVIARSADAGYLAVRDPADYSRRVWLPADVVTIDSGQPELGALAMAGCPAPEPAAQDGAPAATTPPAQQPPAAPPTPSDVSAPSVSVGTFSPQPLYGTESAAYCPTTSTIVVTASDSSGITSVGGTLDLPGGTVTLQSSSGSGYVFAVRTPYTGFSDATGTVTFTVVDSVGNSASASASLGVRATCLN